ncbi:MAG: hypothetical protein J3R72DRAFT_501478 [Linnemannia gamsii]|nr:MAG: hypothetical protein J3R72DRAFT_501478 [Linnemannia gamsii]
MRQKLPELLVSRLAGASRLFCHLTVDDWSRGTASLDFGKILRQCPLLEALIVETRLRNWATLMLEEPMKPHKELALRSFTLNHTTMHQHRLEHLLESAPKLKVLKLIAMVNSGLDLLQLLGHIKSLPIVLETFHLSMYDKPLPRIVHEQTLDICPITSELNIWATDMSPTLFKELEASTSYLTTLELHWRRKGGPVSCEKIISDTITAQRILFEYLCHSPHAIHLRSLKTAIIHEDMDIIGRGRYFNPIGHTAGTHYRSLQEPPSSPGIWRCRNLRVLHVNLRDPYTTMTRRIHSRIVFGYISRVVPQLEELEIFDPYDNSTQGVKAPSAPATSTCSISPLDIPLILDLIFSFLNDYTIQHSVAPVCRHWFLLNKHRLYRTVNFRDFWAKPQVNRFNQRLLGAGRLECMLPFDCLGLGRDDVYNIRFLLAHYWKEFQLRLEKTKKRKAAIFDKRKSTTATATAVLFDLIPLRSMHLQINVQYMTTTDSILFPPSLISLKLVYPHGDECAEDLTKMMRMCPLLETLSIEVDEKPGRSFLWTLLDQEHQPTPLPLRLLNFRNVSFAQSNLENLLSFTPRLKTLTLMAMNTEAHSEYDWTRLLEHIKARGIMLDSVHFSAYGHHSHLDILPRLGEMCPSVTSWTLWTLKTVVRPEYFDLFGRRNQLDTETWGQQTLPLPPAPSAPAIWVCRGLETLHIDIHGAIKSKILFGYVSRVFPRLVDLSIQIPERFQEGEEGVEVVWVYPGFRVDLKGGFSLLSRLEHLRYLRLLTDSLRHPIYERCSKADLNWMLPSGRKIKYRRKCLGLEYFELEGNANFELTWKAVTTADHRQQQQQQQQEQKVLSLRSFILNNTWLKQDSLENLLVMTPQLKVLKLIAMSSKVITLNPGGGPKRYDELQLLSRILSLSIAFDTFQLSCGDKEYRTPPQVMQQILDKSPSNLSEWHLWTFDTSPSLLTQLHLHTNRLTTLELHAPRDGSLCSRQNCCMADIKNTLAPLHYFLTTSDDAVHLRTLKTVARLEDFDLYCRVRYYHWAMRLMFFTRPIYVHPKNIYQSGDAGDYKRSTSSFMDLEST